MSRSSSTLNRPTWILGDEVGQLVHAEDAAIGCAGSGRSACVSSLDEVAALGVLDHVDLADQVGDRDVGRGQLLVIALGRGRSSRSGVSSPWSATRSRAYCESGANGSSLTSRAGDDRDRRRRAGGRSCRSMRVLAWPRRPRKSMSCCDRMAFMICGTTVSS